MNVKLESFSAAMHNFIYVVWTKAPVSVHLGTNDVLGII